VFVMCMCSVTATMMQLSPALQGDGGPAALVPGVVASADHIS
jgi:hypothetical protein